MDIKEEILKDFREKFVMKGSDCTWNVYPTPEEVENFLSQAIDRVRKERDEFPKINLDEEINKIWDELMNYRLDNAVGQWKAKQVFIPAIKRLLTISKEVTET